MKYAFIHKKTGQVLLSGDPTSNHIHANGREVRRDEYPELFILFGTRYGRGDGRTTFNLPRLTWGA